MASLLAIDITFWLTFYNVNYASGPIYYRERLLHACERELESLDISINYKKSCCHSTGSRHDVKCANVISLSGRAHCQTLKYLWQTFVIKWINKQICRNINFEILGFYNENCISNTVCWGLGWAQGTMYKSTFYLLTYLHVLDGGSDPPHGNGHFLVGGEWASHCKV